jgi:hypothetical protein
LAKEMTGSSSTDKAYQPPVDKLLRLGNAMRHGTGVDYCWSIQFAGEFPP